MPRKSDISRRFSDFGQSRFGSEHGWKSRFAEALEVSPQQLNDYLSGRRSPGNSTQTKLRDLGCDIEWLMTGKSADGKKSKREPFVAFHAPAGISDEMKRAVQKLIDGLADLEPDDVESVRKIVKEAFRKKK